MAGLLEQVVQAAVEMVETLAHLRGKTGMRILVVEVEVVVQPLVAQFQPIAMAAQVDQALSSSSTQSHRLLRLM
jgi:hypothetical protein